MELRKMCMSLAVSTTFLFSAIAPSMAAANQSQLTKQQLEEKLLELQARAEENQKQVRIRNEVLSAVSSGTGNMAVKEILNHSKLVLAAIAAVAPAVILHDREASAFNAYREAEERINWHDANLKYRRFAFVMQDLMSLSTNVHMSKEEINKLFLSKVDAIASKHSAEDLEEVRRVGQNVIAELGHKNFLYLDIQEQLAKNEEIKHRYMEKAVANIEELKAKAIARGKGWAVPIILGMAAAGGLVYSFFTTNVVSGEAEELLLPFKAMEREGQTELLEEAALKLKSEMVLLVAEGIQIQMEMQKVAGLVMLNSVQ